MALEIETSPAPAPEKSPTDLAILWRKAFNAYNEKVGDEGKKLKLDGTELVVSLNGVIGSVESSSKSFRKWRHDGNKLDKVRSIIGENLEYVQAIGDQVIDAATAAFPASGAIWTVVTFAIKACQKMSADYDQLLTLIGESGNFLKTLQIIEENVPNVQRYAEFVTDALTSLMMVFAVQTRFMIDGRALQFWYSLKGGDSELSKAYNGVTLAIDRLSRANSFVAVRNTEDIKGLLIQYGKNSDSYYEEMVKRMDDQGQLITDGFEKQERTVVAGFEQQNVSLTNIQQSIKELQNQLSHQSTPDSTQPTTDLSSRSLTALNKVRQFFGKSANPISTFKELKRSFVPGTDSWFQEDLDYKAWLNGETPVLWLAGEAGVGKSHLAYSAIRTLQERTKSHPRTSVAYFFFQEGNELFRSGRNALCSIGLQMAMQDHKLRETMASLISDDCCVQWAIPYIWKWVFLDVFKEDQDAELFLVLDGVDEAEAEDFYPVLACLSDVREEKLRMHVLFTGRRNAGIEPFAEEEHVKEIEATLSKSRMGLKNLVDARFETLPRLSKFSHHVKTKIGEAMLKGNYGPLYVDRFLQNLDSKGMERPALKAIEQMPEDLSSLYDEIIVKCYENREPKQIEALKLAFTWMAFSERPLSLEEVYSLLLLKNGSVGIDLEEEIAGKCSSILEISSTVFIDESKSKYKDVAEGNVSIPKNDSSGSDIDLPSDSSLFLQFQERSLREHFRGETKSQTIIRDSPLVSYLNLFSTTVDVLTKNFETPEQHSASVALQIYAVGYWLRTFVDLDEAEGSQDQEENKDEDEGTEDKEKDPKPFSATEDQIIQVVEGLYRITSNQNNVSGLIMEHGDKCYDSFDEDVAKVFGKWAKWGLECTQDLSKEAKQWATETTLKPEEVLQPLARGHVEYWFTQLFEEPVKRAYKIALKAFKTKFGEDYEDAATGKQAQAQKEQSDILALSNAFNIEKRPSAALAIGALFTYEAADSAMSGQQKYEAASKVLTPNLESTLTNRERLATLALLSKNLVQNCDPCEDGDPREIAVMYIEEGLAIPSGDSDDEKRLRQALLVEGSNLDRLMQELDSAATRIEEAMTVWPVDRSNLFGELIVVLDGLGEYEKILEKVEQWGAIRLSLTGERWNEVNMRYQKAAKLTGKEEVMITTYELLEQELSPLKWASPTKYQFALACRRAIGDVPRAKRLLYEILDDETCIDPTTDQHSDTIPLFARRELAEIISQEFRAAKALKEKQAFVKEMEGLPDRKLAKLYSLGDNLLENDPELIIRARMYQKVGPMEIFEDALNKAFKSCVTSLEDDNPWNDQDTLRQLCGILTCLGLEKEAAIALSAQLYNLDARLLEKSLKEIDRLKTGADGMTYLIPQSAVEAPDDEGWEDEDDEAGQGSDDPEAPSDEDGSIPEVEYDLITWGGRVCSGTCAQTGFADWEIPLYRCVICADSDWCEECYQKRATGEGGGWRTYCKHEYIKGPAEGWKGIKDGKIVIEEQEDIEFTKWLKDLESVKWPQAWKRFWLG